MPPKSGTKSWEDVKLIFAALSITATLGLWNVFAANNEKPTVQAAVSQPTLAPVVQPAFHGKILLGGRPPSQTVVVVQNNSKHTGSGSSSNNNVQAQAPAPVTNTSSS
jgi:hypothetical protein